MLYNDAQQIFAFFFNSIHEVKLVSHFPVLHFPPRIFGPPFSRTAFSVLHFPVPYFPVLHFSTLESWSLIFQWCRSLFDLSGPSLIPHFPVLHFQSTRFDDKVANVQYEPLQLVFNRLRSVPRHPAARCLLSAHLVDWKFSEPRNVLSYEVFLLICTHMASTSKFSLVARLATLGNSGNLHKSKMAATYF